MSVCLSGEKSKQAPEYVSWREAQEEQQLAMQMLPRLPLLLEIKGVSMCTGIAIAHSSPPVIGWISGLSPKQERFPVPRW